jgi:hypothetical protein
MFPCHGCDILLVRQVDETGKKQYIEQASGTVHQCSKPSKTFLRLGSADSGYCTFCGLEIVEGVSFICHPANSFNGQVMTKGPMTKTVCCQSCLRRAWKILMHGGELEAVAL